MWAVLSKEEVPHLKIRAAILSPPAGCGLLELSRAEPVYTALVIHVLPADARWLRELAAAANGLAAGLEIAAQIAAEDAEAERMAAKAGAASTLVAPMPLADAMANPDEFTLLFPSGLQLHVAITEMKHPKEAE